ncbi:MAG: site-specific integrase [Rhodospirillaceae bacterium]|jgi:integrase|nr:site-specific integrase [Rhodospirillaceae bacterium]MBT5778851.1 site-specific integrase [Rhodospirillaceae bacterium]MBT7293640.1 site-specific integrase [Rhodospirillaceae bacterium]
MSKRGQNEGSIFKRQDGRWVAVLNLGYTGGKRRRKHFYGETRKEVQERLTAALRARQQGLPVAPEKQTVGQFLERWLDESVKPNVRPRTYEGYEGHVRLHIVPAIGRSRLVKLAGQDIESLMNGMRRHGYSERTIQYTLTVLRQALGRAHKWGLIAQNVATLVDRPKARRPEVQPFNPDQARTFLAAIKGDRLEALYTVALAVGLRKGEALGLHWDDVDFDVATVRVRKALQRVNGSLQLVDPKSTRSRRTVSIPEIAVVSLRMHRARQLQERLLAGSRWQECGLVFTSTIGTPFDPRNVNRHFSRTLKQVSLPHQRFHDLRHGCATLLLAQGVHPRVVMDILGHSQISLTMDTYSHVIPELQQRAASEMDSILTG